MRLASRAYASIAQSHIADKLWKLLPVLETRLGSRETQRLADSFAVRDDTPKDRSPAPYTAGIFEKVQSFLDIQSQKQWWNHKKARRTRGYVKITRSYSRTTQTKGNTRD